MKSSLKVMVSAVALSTLAIAPLFLNANSAAAETVGFDGSYIGAGPAAGATNGGNANDAATFGGNIQGRFAVPNTPVSVRGSVLFTDKTSALLPVLSYDIPVAPNTNVYTGVGYSFVQNSASPTPLGNKNAVVLTTGVESEVAKNIVVYGDAKYGINAYQNSSASALSFQAGVGFRF